MRRHIRWWFLPLLFAAISCRGFEQHSAFVLASQAAGEGKPAKAVQYMDGVLRDDPTNKRAVQMRAKYKRDAGDHAGAIEDYSRSLELDPAEAVMYVHRADCRMKMLRPDALAAEQALEAVRIGMAPEILADYNRALQLDAKTSQALGKRAILYLAMRSDADAESDIAAFHKLEPSGANRRAFDEQVTRVRALRYLTP